MEKNYKELKTLNPKLPILIRECSGVEPQLWARYGIDHLKFNFLICQLVSAITFCIISTKTFPC